MVKLM